MSTKPNTCQITYDTGSNKQDLNSILDTVVPIADYAALRAYSGRATQIRITDPGISGFFYKVTPGSADDTDNDNGGTIIRTGYTVNGSGVVTNPGTTRWKRHFDGAVNVKWFGAVSDDVADDTTAINNAITFAGVGRTVFFPSGTYVVTSQLTQLQSQAWVGEGGQRASTLKKVFNGDMIIPGSFGTISTINLDANGATYSGRGIYVSGGFSIRIERVRVNQSAGVSLEFANSVGGGSHVCDFEATTTNPTVVPAIKIQDTSGPAPKFFDGIWLSGGLFDFSGGGNGSSLTNFYIRNFVTSAPSYPSYADSSGLFHASNGRVASISDTTTISGADSEFSNISFSGPVYITKTQGIKMVGCTFGSGITEDTATSRYNSWDDQLKSFSSIWSQPTGTQPSIGNGTLSVNYHRNGYVCHVFLSLTVGSSTTFGNSASAWNFSLPFMGHASINQTGFVGAICDSSATGSARDVIVIGSVGALDSNVSFGIQGQGVRDGFPIAWATGDTLKVSFTYMVK